MASWVVDFVQDDISTLVDLIDSPGPDNEWKAHDPNALIPNRGTFMNQFGNAASPAPMWSLTGCDIKEVKPDDEGNASMDGNDGTFPNGSFRWKIVKQIKD